MLSQVTYTFPQRLNRVINFLKPILVANSVLKCESETIALNTMHQNESEAKFKVESEIPNIPPTRYNVSSGPASQAWKNLRLKVKTAKAFNNQLANHNIRRYGYDPREFQLS